MTDASEAERLTAAPRSSIDDTSTSGSGRFGAFSNAASDRAPTVTDTNATRTTTTTVRANALSAHRPRCRRTGKRRTDQALTGV